MDAIETKALALVNEVAAVRGTEYPCVDRRNDARWEAICRTIEQHEAFRQEVSKAITDLTYVQHQWTFARGEVLGHLEKFVLKEPVDPLVEALTDCLGRQSGQGEADDLRAAIEKRGGRIVWGEG